MVVTMRVLLVEDDVTAARGISLILKSAGFTVDHTDMGREALEMVRRYDYDLIRHRGLRGRQAVARRSLVHAGDRAVRALPATGEGQGFRGWRR